MKPFTIVGIGEALFDLLPAGEVLGGAPLNVVVHAQQFAAPLGGRAVMVSRVGADERGQRLRDELAARGLDATYIQTDPQRPTGTVRVTLDRGEPSYDIVRDVAWDRLEFTPELSVLAATCHAVCYGTLAQREETARQTIRRFLEAATQAIRLFDVNLRQHYYDEALLRRGFELATFAKMNEAELLTVAETLGMKTNATNKAAQIEELAHALGSTFHLGAVIVTRGARGMTLYTEDSQIDAPPMRYPPQPNADHVGAGDACSAALLVGMVRDWSPLDTLLLANRLGAYVASVPGATPTLTPEILAMADE
jgi:fructokinase